MQDVGGAIETDPADAPGDVFEAVGAYASVVVANENFETGTGWSVTNVDLADGAWEIANPAGGGTGAPGSDADGSGKCFVTGAASSRDVDGGPTYALSPVYDLSGYGAATLSYYRWIKSTGGSQDKFLAEVSGDGGTTWVTIENVPPPLLSGWTRKEWDVASFVPLTSTVRFRFSTSDNPNDSNTEGGLDAFLLHAFDCSADEDCIADFNDDGEVNSLDFIDYLNAFSSGDLSADMDGNGVINSLDFVIFLNEFNEGC